MALGGVVGFIGLLSPMLVGALVGPSARYTNPGGGNGGSHTGCGSRRGGQSYRRAGRSSYWNHHRGNRWATARVAHRPGSTMTVHAQQASYAAGGRQILSDVDLTAGQGQIVIIVGPNGAGKSTLLRILAGDLEPDSGSVTLRGSPIAGKPSDELALARAFLGPHPLANVGFSVEEVVTMGRHPHRIRHATTTADDEVIVHESMVAAAVDTIADQVFSKLSSGEAQRVGVARLLAQDAPVSLLDEPTSSLDIGHQHLIMQALQDRTREGHTVVAVLHDLNLAARFADRLVLLAGGSVTASGGPEEVFDADLLSRIYDHPVSVVTNPLTGGPWVLPGDSTLG